MAKRKRFVGVGAGSRIIKDDLKRREYDAYKKRDPQHNDEEFMFRSPEDEIQGKRLHGRPKRIPNT